jgi:uncharacterized repeat protein (TIGR02543 family)
MVSAAFLICCCLFRPLWFYLTLFVGVGLGVCYLAFSLVWFLLRSPARRSGQKPQKRKSLALERSAMAGAVVAVFLLFFLFTVVKPWSFRGPFYTLTIPASASCSVSPNLDAYASGTSVTITATAPAGWTFDHWGGDASGTSNPVTVTMDSDKSVTAYFVQNGGAS